MSAIKHQSIVSQLNKANKRIKADKRQICQLYDTKADTCLRNKTILNVIQPTIVMTSHCIYVVLNRHCQSTSAISSTQFVTCGTYRRFRSVMRYCCI